MVDQVAWVEEVVNPGAGRKECAVPGEPDLFCCALLDEAEKDCCMATGSAAAMLAIHSCACRAPSDCDPVILYELAADTQGRHSTMHHKDQPKVGRGRRKPLPDDLEQLAYLTRVGEKIGPSGSGIDLEDPFRARELFCPKGP